MTSFFKFETDFVESLRCIPMQVRMKLDTCGIKLKLACWHQFNLAERQTLVEMPCQTLAQIEQYRQYLQQRVRACTGKLPSELPIDEHPPWLNPTEIPPSLQQKAKAAGVSITEEQWANLSPLRRFALIKLSRPSHESKNFLPAMQEFNLLNSELPTPNS